MDRSASTGSRRGLPAPGLLLFTILTALLALGFGARVAGAQEGEDAGKKAGEQKDTEKKDTEKKPAYDFKGWGQLGAPVKDAEGFYDLTYYKLDERGRLKSVKAFVKLPEGLEPLMDRRVTDKQLAEGDEVFVFGKPVSKSNSNPFGLTMKQNNFTNCRAVYTGKDVEVNEKYQDRRDKELKWYKVKYVSDLRVTYDKEEYRLILGRSCPILKRQKGDPKYLRKGAYIHVCCQNSAERPATKKKSDEDKKAYEVKKVVILDRRYYKTVYPFAFE